jgi:hypothetical protein
LRFRIDWKARWKSAFRRPLLIERRHRFANKMRLPLPALRAIAHPRRGLMTMDDLKIRRAA